MNISPDNIRNSSNKRFRFTEARLRNLIVPTHKDREYYYDTDVRALEVCVTAKGTKSFNVYQWSSAFQKPVRVHLGKVGTLGVEDARKLAAKALLEILQGGDPNLQKRSRREETTLGDAVTKYIDWLKASEKKNTTLVTYGYLVSRYIVPWNNRRLSSITSSDLLSLRGKIRELSENDRYDRKVTANRLLRLLSQIFNHAIREGWMGQNPCIAIKPYQERPIIRRLEDHEIGAFIRACHVLRDGGDRAVDFHLLALFTGVRRRNISRSRWSEFNLPFRIWDIPDTKNNLGHRAYLSNVVVEILNRRKKEGLSNEFVFPAASRSGHLQEPRKCLHRILAKAGIEINGFTIHSLKHTFISLAFEAGINPLVVSRMGGHKIPGITARYGHASERKVREGYEELTQYILRLEKLKFETEIEESVAS